MKTDCVRHSTVLLLAVMALMSFTHGVVSAQDNRPEPQFQLSQNDLNGFDDLAVSYVQTGQIANVSYGVWQYGALIKDGFHGTIPNDSSTRVADDTIYQIYSMTKLVTAVGMLILNERGCFDLDDPITTVLPEFEGIEVVADYDEDGELYTFLPPEGPTFRQLLSHTAGFAYQSESRHPVDRAFIELDVANAPSGDDLVARVTSMPLMRSPGSEWNYSIASDLQGVVIERLTGETLHGFLTREIFDRLNMRDTGFFIPEEKATRVSAVTRRSANGLNFDPRVDLSKEAQALTYFEGGHGLVSTLADYHRFLETLRRGGSVGPIQILTPESVVVLSSNAIRYKGQPAPQRGYGSQSGLGYGFGVGIVENPSVSGYHAPKGSYFWYGALGSWFWVDPTNEIVFIGMIQTQTPISPDIIKASMTSVYGPPEVETAPSTGALP